MRTVVWTSIYNPCDGYGGSAEQMIIALDRVGNNVIFKPHLCANTHLSSPFSQCIFATSHEVDIPPVFLDAHFILYAQPQEQGIPAKFGGKTVNFTMWETSKLPPSWAGHMTKFTDVWVPTEWGKQVMIESGVKNPISVVPLGVNTSLFTPRPAKESGPFEFLTYVCTGYQDQRKNLGQIIDAFQHAFGNSMDVTLTIKTGHGYSPQDLPLNIRVVTTSLSIDEVVAMLHSADCFVFISSGEGYGLPPREAMAAGVPVILGNTSALRDIAHPAFCVPVQTSGTRRHVCPPHYGSPQQLGFVDTYNTSDIVNAMKFVHTNYDRAINRATMARKHVVNTMSYAHTAARIEELLDGN